MAAKLLAFTIFLIIAQCYTASASRQLTGAASSKVSELPSEQSEQTLFDTWIQQHSKVYADAAEKSARFNVFKDNLRRVYEHNSKPSSYKLGLTKFADLSPEEFKAKYLKTRFRRNDRSSQEPTFTYANVESVPKAVDWRKKGAVTAIKDQGECGSCWAFSTIGAVEGINQIKTGKLISLSEQELVSCDVTANTQGCEGGYMDYGFEFIAQNGGVDSEKDYPYTAEDDSCNSRKENKVAATISSYEDVPANSEKDLQKAVANQPVSVAIDAGDGDFQLYTSGIYDGTCGTELDHGVVAVGYGTSGGTDFWIVKNSWGESWGEEGYIRMQRNIDAPEGLCGIAMMASYPTKTGN
ncbi:hypothetical protein Mapa_009618 [Marchantia paleacea]|nr:hypothetical protein Mapa_009618 [Marchantia paleacea]